MLLGGVEQIAQRVVDATAPLVNGRTINIMDRSGVIIASSDTGRIGTFHPGAAQAAAGRETVRIHRDDLSLYPGAREGINLPILQQGELLGVVGILGDPKEVEDAANLLRVCVELYLEQAAAASARQAGNDIRREKMRRLLRGEEPGAADVGFPVRVAVVCLPERQDGQRDHARTLELAERTLCKHGFWRQDDLYGVLDGQLAAILRREQDAARMQRLLSEIETGDKGISVAVGAPAACAGQVAQSYREALALCRLQTGYADALDHKNKLLYLLDSVDTQARARMLEPMFQRMADGFGEKNIGWALDTVRVWCDTGRSAKQAAERLHIHKNTLLYRIKKVETLLGVEQEETFVRECLMRMLLLYCDTKMKKDG